MIYWSKSVILRHFYPPQSSLVCSLGVFPSELRYELPGLPTPKSENCMMLWPFVSICCPLVMDRRMDEQTVPTIAVPLWIAVLCRCTIKYLPEQVLHHKVPKWQPTFPFPPETVSLLQSLKSHHKHTKNRWHKKNYYIMVSGIGRLGRTASISF